MNKPTHLILHHTGVDSDLPQLPAVEKYHKEKGFPKSSLGFHTGYHRMISKNGIVFVTRADAEEGAHTLKGWNTKSIGVCLDGDFNKHAPTAMQIAVTKALIQSYELPWMFHKEADADRTCAGLYFTRDLIENKPKLLPPVEKAKIKAISANVASSGFLDLLKRLFRV